MNMPNKRAFKNTLTAVLVAGTALSSGAAMAANTKVAALAIDGLYQKDGKGLYDQILVAVGKRFDQSFDIQAVAPNRAFQDFETGKVSCISPANTNPDFYDFEFATVASASMTTAKIYIFTKEGSQPITDLTALKGKKVGVRTGMPYGAKVEGAGLILVKSKTIEANIKKLQAGRIDAFLAYYPDVYTIFEDMGLEQFPHAVDQPVAVHEDTLLCRKDKGGDEIVAAFNDGFKEIEASGELATILGE